MMGVRRQKKKASGAQWNILLTAVFMLFAQFFGLLAIPPHDVHASSILTVSPDSMQGWEGIDSFGKGGSVNFINTNGSIGTGSAQFRISNLNQEYSLLKRIHSMLKLNDITSLSYDSYTQTGSFTPTLKLDIDQDVTDTDTSWQGRLVYTPTDSAGDGWQHHDAYRGMWWFSEPSLINNVCLKTSPCSLATLKLLYPNMGIHSTGGVGLYAGGSNVPSVAGVDKLIINEDMYDFEAITPPQLAIPIDSSIVNGANLISEWQPVANAGQYVYESYDDAFAMQLRSHEEITETQIHTDLAHNTVMWWRVKAVDAQGDQGRWSALRKVMVDNTAPSVPNGGIYKGTADGYDLSWDESIDDHPRVTYELRISPDRTFLDDEGSVVEPLESPHYKVTSHRNAPIYWQVRSVDIAGNKSAWSEIWSLNITGGSLPGGVSPLVIGPVGVDSTTQQLLDQVAHLNEPFTVPDSFSALPTPKTLKATDDVLLGARTAVDPTTDQNVKLLAVTPSEDGWRFFGLSWYWWGFFMLAIGYGVYRNTTKQTFVVAQDV